MIRVGIAGVGFMGMIHYLSYQRTEGAVVGAICTRDPKKRAGDWTDIKGNFGPPGEMMDLSGIATYEHLDEMLADDSLDLIDICLPPNLHADIACSALSNGKHVFCEKPIALATDECRRMINAAEEAGKQILIGHILPLLPEYAHALQLVNDGTYGKVIGGSFKRVISNPLWIPDFYDPKTIGGPLVDLHIHDAHFIRVLFGMPTEVISQGRMRDESVEYCNTLFRFEDPSLVVSAASGVIHQQGRSFTHGFELHLERATLQYELAVVGDNAELLMPLTIYDDEGKVSRPELGNGDMTLAFDREVQEVVRSIDGGTPSEILSGDLAADALVLCHRQTESVKTGKPVSIR